MGREARVVLADQPQTESNADHLLPFEHAAHLDPKRVLNSALAPVSWLSAAAGYNYLTLNFAVMVTALVLLYFRRPHLYTLARTSLVAANYTAALPCRRGEPPL